MSAEFQEDFQSYMDGGARRPKRGVRAAPRRSASPKRRPAAAAAPKRVAPMRRSAPKRHPMASLYGGFFESLEGFANEVAADKKKKVEMYADDKNPMTPLAKEATKGGAKKAKSKAGVKKPKTGVRKPKTGVKKSMTKHHGGYEEQEQEQQEQEQQEQEDFVNIKDAVDKVQQLLSGGYLRRRVAPKRRPAATASPKRRPAAAAPKRRVVRSYA